MKKLFRNEKGFTIIEVVLVLAIAGLIFLVVFLALPQLQRSRRDSQRKSDVGRAVAALESYAGNNNGNYPEDQDEVDDLADDYLRADGSAFADPQGGDYDLIYSTSAVSGLDPEINAADGAEMYITVGNACDGGDNSRDVGVVAGVEEGSKYCQDNR